MSNTNLGTTDWRPDLIMTATRPVESGKAAYAKQLLRTVTADAYQTWLPHMASYLRRGTPGEPVALTAGEMMNLADWYSLAGEDAPLYAMSGMGMVEVATRVAAEQEPDDDIRARAAEQGWVDQATRTNSTRGA